MLVLKVGWGSGFVTKGRHSYMKKLLKKKKYFTVFDAAKYLTSALEEPVSVADVYELVLEGELTLSARFINTVYASKLQESEEVSHDVQLLSSIQKVALEQLIYVIDGVWDLALIGLEAHEVKSLYQQAVEGPPPILNDLDGFFLTKDGAIYKVLDSLPLSMNQDSRHALETRLDNLAKANRLNIEDVLSDQGHIWLSELGDEAFGEFAQLSGAFAMQEDEDEHCMGYLELEEPTYQYVVRVTELNRFLQSLEDEQEKDESKPIDPRERTTLLIMLGALCKSKNIEVDERESAGKVMGLVEQLGISMKHDVVRSKLNAVPAAIESRKLRKSL